MKPYMLNPELDRAIYQHFFDSGYGPLHAQQCVDILAETVFNTHIATTNNMEDIAWLAALSFGGQHDENGNISLPGPENEVLADLLVSQYQKKPVPVCVQWEVALALKDNGVIPPDHLHVIHTRIDPLTAKHAHFSTQDVLQEMIQHLAATGVVAQEVPVGLFAHYYHLPRVIAYAEQVGITKIASPVEQLPRTFDSHCAYPWTRDFRGFWMSHTVSAIARKRNLAYLTKPHFYCHDSVKEQFHVR